MKRTVNTPGYLRSKAAYRRLYDTLCMIRDLYNVARLQRINAYKHMKKSVGYEDQCAVLTHLRDHNPKWRNLSVFVARGALRRLDNSFQGFFARCKRGEKPGFPREKNRYRTLSVFGVTKSNFKYDATTGKGKVKFKGLDPIRFKNWRVPVKDGKAQIPSTIHITRRPSGSRIRIQLSLVFDIGDAPKIDNSVVPCNPVGIDVGITERAVTSSGERLPRRVRDARRERREKRLQRKMARQKKAALREKRAEIVFRGEYTKTGKRKYHLEWVGGRPSRGYRNTRKELARIRYREQMRDRNELHRWTTGIVRAHDGIAVEDMEIKNMMKSAKGTQEEPGKNVAQKRGLNRSIGEQSWSTIYLQLEYKAERAGIPFKKVDPKHTSQTCSACGSVDAASRKRKKFRCVSCGYDADAEDNAAVNIRSRGFPDAAGLLPRGRQPTQPECVVVPETYHHTLGEQIPLWNFHGG